jgi:hypothetical protein
VHPPGPPPLPVQPQTGRLFALWGQMDWRLRQKSPLRSRNDLHACSPLLTSPRVPLTVQPSLSALIIAIHSSKVAPKLLPARCACHVQDMTNLSDLGNLVLHRRRPVYVCSASALKIERTFLKSLRISTTFHLKSTATESQLVIPATFEGLSTLSFVRGSKESAKMSVDGAGVVDDPYARLGVVSSLALPISPLDRCVFRPVPLFPAFRTSLPTLEHFRPQLRIPP